MLSLNQFGDSVLATTMLRTSVSLALHDRYVRRRRYKSKYSESVIDSMSIHQLDINLMSAQVVLLLVFTKVTS